MARFAMQKRPQNGVLNIESFGGVDLYNASANVSINRSPHAPNMIRDEVGKVRKRMGYKLQTTYSAPIHGVHFLNDIRIVHTGAELHWTPTNEQPRSYVGLNNGRSKSWQMNGKLYIQDGVKLLEFDGTNVVTVESKAHVPVIIISRKPSGGGTTLEPLNLLGRKWEENFLGTATDTVYQLTASNLDSDPVTVQTLSGNGTWTTLTEGTQFTVNRTTGVVTFVAAPGASPIAGQDNIKIIAAKTREGYADRINKCDISILYGVSGAPDRVFVAGNPAFPNLDYFSQLNDPTFFGDTWYSVVGQDGAVIVGYTVLNNQLATYLSRGEGVGSIVVRNGTLIDGKAAFNRVNTISGEAAIGKCGFATNGREPFFLTRLGIYAITSAELTSEKYAQHRSLYISPALQNLPSPEDAFAFSWRDYYLLAANNTIFLLDTLQKSYEKDAPYSSYQCECYVWHGIDARVLWEEGDTLWFGTTNGFLCSFYTDKDSPSSYNDNGAAIDAFWETPDIDGKLYYKNKTFRHIAVRLASAPLTGLRISVQKKGLWSPLFDAGEKARYLDWSYVDFSKFVFSADRTPKTIGGKIKIKNVDKVRFRLQNNKHNEPFGIYSFSLEYTQGNNYKG